MKNFITLLFLLFFYGLSAQKASVRKAHELFHSKAYIEAAKIYAGLKPDQEILQNLADCYYYNSNMPDAVKIYTLLYGSYKIKIDKEVLFRYAHALMTLETYDKADQIMSEYLGYKVDTPKFIENLKENGYYQYELQPMTKEILSGDFGVAYFGEKIVFASTRNSQNPIYAWNGKPYLDLFIADVSKDGYLENVLPFSDVINTPTHESSPVFTPDRKTMYFNRTNDKRIKVGNEEFASIKLFRAEEIDGIWTNITELPFSSDNYSVQNPTLSPDGKRLYFASDMPGTLGSMDIFYVDLYEDGTFGVPTNLGEEINTKHREQFPYVSPDNKLYFASDGHQGFGGLDIFVSEIIDGKYSRPENAGEVINSSYDDFCFVLNPETDTGYISSNRKGTDNLYSFRRNYVGRKFTIEGVVKDKNTKELLPGTTVTLYDEAQRLIAQVVVGADGKYFFGTQPNTQYRIEAVKDLYIPFNEEVTTNEEGRVLRNIELLLESYEDAESIIKKGNDGLTYIQLENIYFDFDKWDILSEAKQTLNILVDLMKKYPRAEVELRAHTDSRASQLYNLSLSNKRAQSAVEYLISQGINQKRLRWKGYGKSNPLIDCGENCTETEFAINRRVEFVILK